MIIKLAWKNVWRNKVRSGVVMAAVAVGIWAMMFILSFMQGMVSSYINQTIESRTSHLQVHHTSFPDDPDMAWMMHEDEISAAALMQMDEVIVASQRIVTDGLISSAAGNRGARIKGVDPGKESLLTALDQKITEGEYLDADRRNPIVMSAGLGQKLGVSLNQHVVINFQGLDGDFLSGRFRVVGWYSTGDVRADEITAFVRYDDLARIAELPGGSFHEIAMNIDHIDGVRETRAKLQELYPDLMVRAFFEVAPDLALYNEQIMTSLFIVIVVIMLALLFGIINTMLMAVLERIRELGMMMAIGMNRIRLFVMIMMESVFMCVFAAPIGLLAGHLTIVSLHNRGIDLSAWARGFEQFGLSTIIRPELESVFYIQIVVALVVTALVAGVYPAIKAVRTKPAEALRKI